MKSSLAISLVLASASTVAATPTSGYKTCEGDEYHVTNGTSIESFVAPFADIPECDDAVAAIMAENPVESYASSTETAVFSTDQELCIPSTCSSAYVLASAVQLRGPEKDSCDGTLITVAQNDTLEAFSQLNGVELDSIKAANQQFAPNYDLIYPGEIVCVPSSCYPQRKVLASSEEMEATCESSVLIVADGDTLDKIATDKDLDLDTLIAANTQIQEALLSLMSAVISIN
jgi:LysM repeat protein